MSIPIWYNDPSILLNKKDIFSIWPSSCMEYKRKNERYYQTCFNFDNSRLCS